MKPIFTGRCWAIAGTAIRTASAVAARNTRCMIGSSHVTLPPILVDRPERQKPLVIVLSMLLRRISPRRSALGLFRRAAYKLPQSPLDRRKRHPEGGVIQ